RDCNARFGVGIERSIDAKLGPGCEAIRYLWNFLPGRSNMEGTHNVRAYQVGASNRKCIDAIGLSVPAQRQRIRSIEGRGNIQIRDEESSEYRVLVTSLPIQPRNLHVFALIGFQSEIYLATWVARLWKERCDLQRKGTDQRRGNLVVHESLRRRQRKRFGLARRPGKSGEVAAKHGWSWNVGGILRGL